MEKMLKKICSILCFCKLHFEYQLCCFVNFGSRIQKWKNQSKKTKNQKKINGQNQKEEKKTKM